MNIGWSNFALGRHRKGFGYSYFDGSDEDLFERIRRNWHQREVGAGAESVDDVCLVPVEPEGFVGTKVRIEDAESLRAEIVRRQAHERPFVKVFAEGGLCPVNHVKVVLYAAHELLKNNGERSGDYDWEIVCVVASDIEDEPMNPLVMARNQLEMAGGTPRRYTSDEWARSVGYWAGFVSAERTPDSEVP